MGRKKIISPSPVKRKKVDWNRLWMAAKTVFETSGRDRQRAVLENFKDQKEEICRVLGIVSEADLARIQRQIETSDSMKGK
jgi:hypothetical protein